MVSRAEATPQLSLPPPPLTRGIGLLPAIATNVIGMVGVGPFLTIPVMVSVVGGKHIIYAWLAGALLALCDGLVYAQLGAALPGSGGAYVYLREAYKPFGLGKFLSFLFVFQVILTAPLSIAGGAVGFADYLGFFWPQMPSLVHDLAAAGLCALVVFLLYRPIESVGRLSTIMLGIVVIAIGWIVIAGLYRFSPAMAFDFPAQARRLDTNLLTATGAGAMVAMYNYGGYNTVCNLGDELTKPEKTLPRAVVGSIVIVVAVYIVMSTVVLGVVPESELRETRTIASVFVKHLFTDPTQGNIASGAMNILILAITAGSIYALTLGYSRVPFAAARDGQFPKFFKRTHPTKNFPHYALLTVGLSAIPFCFIDLKHLILWLMLVQIVVQFIWQCAAVILLQRYRQDINQPFRMWLYPLPAIVALALWVGVLLAAPLTGIAIAVGFFVLGAAVYAWFAHHRSRLILSSPRG